MTEVATVPGADLSDLRSVYDPALDFRKLALEAEYFSRGFRLVAKDDLIAIPHVIISITYREGYLSADKKIQGDYISVEAVVADKATLESPQTTAMRKQSGCDADLAVYPNETVVYNDGGTGIRREFTHLFDTLGLIDVGAPDDDRRYDRPYSLWKTGAELATTGITLDHKGDPFRFVAMRGLRRSDYESPFGEATTFYIA